MFTIHGRGACGGITFGKLYQLKKSDKAVKKTHIEDERAEEQRFDAAIKECARRLDELYAKALSEVGGENAMIFEIHRMMLEDEDFLTSVRSAISQQKINAEAAVAMTADNFAEMFEAMDDSYMQARATDVRDISERIINVLTGGKDSAINSDEPVIICADDLAPSETVQLDKSKILAFITERGSFNSHTSILARTMNIPAIIGAEGIMDEKYEGMYAAADGFNGAVYIEPDTETKEQLQGLKAKSDEEQELLNSLRGKKSITKDNQSILLYANAGESDDISAAFKNDAQGIGLFRSEFIYLGRSGAPSEEEQFAIYKDAAEKMSGKRVIIRTLDIGADKQVGYLNLPREENPAMGIRAIRFCLKNPDIFKTQLRAIYRASAYGKIAVMFPMIISVEEIHSIREICAEVERELDNENIPYNKEMEKGIMIETPAAAVISDLLAKEVDFFSIGTNDLTQYTTAIDRQNEGAAEFCDIHHTAILRLIKTVCDNAHRYGKWVGICGELGADTKLTELFLAMGIDELSVSPGAILPLRKKIIDTDVRKIRDKALSMLG